MAAGLYRSNVSCRDRAWKLCIQHVVDGAISIQWWWNSVINKNISFTVGESTSGIRQKKEKPYFIHSYFCWSAHLSQDKLCCFKDILNPCKGGFHSGERKIGQYSCTSHRAEHIMTHYLSTKTQPWAGCDGLGWADVTAQSGKTRQWDYYDYL